MDQEMTLPRNAESLDTWLLPSLPDYPTNSRERLLPVCHLERILSRTSGEVQFAGFGWRAAMFPSIPVISRPQNNTLRATRPGNSAAQPSRTLRVVADIVDATKISRGMGLLDHPLSRRLMSRRDQECEQNYHAHLSSHSKDREQTYCTGWFRASGLQHSDLTPNK